MCKWCNTKFYYDEYYHQSDGGYGDDDIDEVEKNEVFGLLCCPICGKIKPEAIEKYGSIEKVLEVILFNNLTGKSRNQFNSILENLKMAEKAEIDSFLSLNKLYIKDGHLYHICGRELGDVSNVHGEVYTCYTIKRIYDLINKNDINFCSKCGKALWPLKDATVEEKKVDKPYTVAVERKRI